MLTLELAYGLLTCFGRSTITGMQETLQGNPNYVKGTNLEKYNQLYKFWP